MIVRGRIRSEREVMPLRRFAKPIEHQSRLDPRLPAFRIERDQVAHVLRVVEDDRDVAALAGEARAAAACEHRRTMIAADRHRRDHIVGIARQDDADRDLAVVGRVGRVRGAAAAVEPHLAAHDAPEVGFEIGHRRSKARATTLASVMPTIAAAATAVRCSLIQACTLKSLLRLAKRPCAP